MYIKNKNMNIGAAILFVFFVLLFFVLAGRFIYIQVTGQVDGQVLATKAQEKTLKQAGIESSRGSITDRNGAVIAEDTSSYTLIAILSSKMTVDENNPKHVVDPEETAKKLAKYIDMDESKILKILSNKGAFQVEFGAAGRGLSYAKKNKIEALKLPGITFVRGTKRYYPNGVFASHVIGYAENQYNEKTKKENVTGKLGLEKALQSKLEGTNGKMNYESDRWGFLIPGKEEKIIQPKNGEDVQLTLDKKIQSLLEDSMSKVQKTYNPKKLIAIVSNPKTGEILAMSQRPTFNPNTKEGLSDTWKNLSIEENFEPGSTMKAFTLAAAVEEGVFQPNAYFQAGKYKVQGSELKDHRGITPGKWMTYLQGVQRSSNVAFVKIALEQLGEEKFREYLTKFGFDEPTGIDLPNEVGGKILFKEKVEKATTAFGQGSVITPIQQIQAFSAIANKGKMMKPYVIDEIKDSKGNVIEKTKPTVAGEPISEETAKTVLGYLETVVSDEKGTGHIYGIDGYKVAGKTGTAQIPGPNGRYLSGFTDYWFSFIGAAPAEDPQLTMYVAMLQPELPSGKTAADGISEIFNPVMSNSLRYYNIKPANTTKKSSMKIKDYVGKSVSETSQELKEHGYEVVVLGEGDMITQQAPAVDTMIIQGEKVVLKTNGPMKMHDLTGWSLRDVMKIVNLGELDLNVSGSGYVTKQNIKAGEAISKGEYFIIELQSPDPKKEESNKKVEDEVYD
ncbi:penicillin-binding protein [Bacillus massiliigorillae]|uniref:penicillin-binding protein n=1 Tax=Bacillus massiliigorillae TaxID=1243664 RepID=UPI0003A59542|nr:penicillin-binding protein [Bacillus massiliigorillae]